MAVLAVSHWWNCSSSSPSSGFWRRSCCPLSSLAKSRAKRIECVGDLRETGLAFHLFANDHGGKFTTQVSTNDGGSLEFVTAGYQISDNTFYFSFQHFRPLASALVTPKLLACPADLERWPATNFNQFNNQNLSYDIGLKADPNIPSAILAADRNLPGECWPKDGSVTHLPDLDKSGPPPYLWPPPYWNAMLHVRKGNILFSDGHVEESYDAVYPKQITLREDLVLPTVKPSEITGGLNASTAKSPYSTPAHPGNNQPNENPAPASGPLGSFSANGVPPSTPSSAAASSARPRTYAQNSNASGINDHRSTFSQNNSTGDNWNDATQQTSQASRQSITPEPGGTLAATANPAEPSLKEQAARAARESWQATSWLFWLLLLLLMLCLLARWLDHRWQRARAKRRIARTR